MKITTRTSRDGASESDSPTVSATTSISTEGRKRSRMAIHLEGPRQERICRARFGQRQQGPQGDADRGAQEGQRLPGARNADRLVWDRIRVTNNSGDLRTRAAMGRLQHHAPPLLWPDA